jgi:hypothetical protein
MARVDDVYAIRGFGCGPGLAGGTAFRGEIIGS